METPDVVRFTLEKMRAAVLNDPHVLFEDWGGPFARQGDYIYADVYGFEDELLREFVPLPTAPSVYFTPIRERLTLAVLTDDYRPMRKAEHGLRSGFARASVAAEYLPDWRHDDRFLVNLLYVRYKRRA